MHHFLQFVVCNLLCIFYKCCYLCGKNSQILVKSFNLEKSEMFKRKRCRACVLKSALLQILLQVLIRVKVNRKCCLYVSLSKVFTSVLVYVSDRSHSQRQASTSSSWSERSPPSSPSWAALPRRPGLQIPEETSALHPGPARLGCQLHGPTSCHQGPVDSLRHPSKRRCQGRGDQTSSSY